MGEISVADTFIRNNLERMMDGVAGTLDCSREDALHYILFSGQRLYDRMTGDDR